MKLELKFELHKPNALTFSITGYYKKIFGSVTCALGTKRRPGLRQNRRRLFSAESRKPVSQRYVTPNTTRQESSQS